MDHAHAWRSRPPMPPPPPFAAPSPPANICPVCSISHFPFCPPPYPQTPGMPFNDQFYPRPPPPTTPPPPPPPPQPQPPPPPPPQAPYDPFVDHQPGPTMNPPRPWNANPNPNPSFDRDLYGYSNPSFDYPHAGVKRMRVDESGPGPGPGRASGWAPNLDNSHRVITEDERRLKLIREHGGANHKFDKPFKGIRGGRNGFEAKSLSNYDTDNFRDPNYSNFDRKEIVYSQDSYYNSKKFSEDRFVQQYVHSDRNVEPGRSNYDQGNGYGYSDNSADGYSNAEINRRNSEGMGYGSSMGDWQGVSGANAGYNNSRSGFGMGNRESSNPYSQSYGMQQHGMELKPGHYGYANEQDGSVNRGPSRVFNGQPPLPASPPPPLPVEPPGRQFTEPVVSTSPSGRSLFPIAVASSASGVSSYPSVPEANALPPTYYSNKAHLSAPGGFPSEGIQPTQPASAKRYLGESEKFPIRHISSDKPKVLDASHLLKHPHRATRPDHIVIILRGLPGSGKSYLAKTLRDIEVENGGSAPRIHTMDDYFMTEVEKVEESEGSKPSGSIRVKKLVTKKVMEYCYEPEMEEAYRSSMLKAFKKTLDEGVFSFVIVDDRNLRVADFAQFWATAKRSGYEVFLLEATYKDPVGCAARNIHGFTQDDIQKMADQWEEAPSLYLKLDIKSLLHGDNLEESGIQEVDMDTEDGDVIGVSTGLDDRNPERVKAPPVVDHASNGPSKDDQRWHAEADRQIEEVKELGKSKWSNDLDEDDIHKTEVSERKLSSLSGLIQSYSKEGKTVRWGDQGGNKGFSIGAAAQTSSLVIGPGAGYNLKANPLTDEDKLASRRNTGELKKQNIFQEQMRAERESFRAAFDKRRQRIGGLEVDDE